MTPECRTEDCLVPPGQNGEFCAQHWKMISLETRNVLLKMGRPGPGRNTSTRNKALFAAATEIRAKIRGANERPAS
jgi:hypothetical protein